MPKEPRTRQEANREFLRAVLPSAMLHQDRTANSTEYIRALLLPITLEQQILKTRLMRDQVTNPTRVVEYMTVHSVQAALRLAQRQAHLAEEFRPKSRDHVVPSTQECEKGCCLLKAAQPLVTTTEILNPKATSSCTLSPGSVPPIWHDSRWLTVGLAGADNLEDEGEEDVNVEAQIARLARNDPCIDMSTCINVLEDVCQKEKEHPRPYSTPEKRHGMPSRRLDSVWGVEPSLHAVTAEMHKIDEARLRTVPPPPRAQCTLNATKYHTQDGVATMQMYTLEMGGHESSSRKSDDSSGRFISPQKGIRMMEDPTGKLLDADERSVPESSNPHVLLSKLYDPINYWSAKQTLPKIVRRESRIRTSDSPCPRHEWHAPNNEPPPQEVAAAQISLNMADYPKAQPPSQAVREIVTPPLHRISQPCDSSLSPRPYTSTLQDAFLDVRQILRKSGRGKDKNKTAPLHRPEVARSSKLCTTKPMHPTGKGGCTSEIPRRAKWMQMDALQCGGTALPSASSDRAKKHVAPLTAVPTALAAYAKVDLNDYLIKRRWSSLSRENMFQRKALRRGFFEGHA